MKQPRTLNRRDFLKYASAGGVAALGLSYFGLLTARRTDEQLLEQAATFSRSYRPPDPLPGFTDYRGVIGVHTNLSPDCVGTVDEVVEAAEANHLHFVITTDRNHPDLFARGSDETIKNIVVIRGAEIETAGRRLLAVGVREYVDATKTSVTEVVRAIKAQGSLVFARDAHEYPEQAIAGMDGLEVYNAADVTKARPWKLPLMFADRITPGRRIPAQAFIRGAMARPDAAFEQWDHVTGAHRLVGLANSAARNNAGLSGPLAAPYRLVFSFVQTHLLARASGRQALLAALRAGHTYWSFALLADATGFQFTGATGAERRLPGDEIALAKRPVLSVRSPQRCLIRLYHDGRVIREETADRMEQIVQDPGAYRAEAFLSVDGALYPWVFTNKIYVF